MTVELLHFQPESRRSTLLFNGLTKTAPAAGIALRSELRHFRGGSDLLLLWGPGAPDRFPPMRQQLDAGRRVVAFDLSYWHRDTKARVSIDAPHPQAWLLKKDWPETRLQADNLVIADRWKATGPIVVAGIGRKARVQYGGAVLAWEAQLIEACRARWPQRRLIYRRKHPDAPVPSNVPASSAGTMDDALSGASLLITWHSNAAVDAIRLGIPVICKDGAAAAVYPSTLGPDDPQPIPTTLRDRVLANLAWFQWGLHELAGFWHWLRELLA